MHPTDRFWQWKRYSQMAEWHEMAAESCTNPDHAVVHLAEAIVHQAQADLLWAAA